GLLGAGHPARSNAQCLPIWFCPIALQFPRCRSIHHRARRGSAKVSSAGMNGLAVWRQYGQRRSDVPGDTDIEVLANPVQLGLRTRYHARQVAAAHPAWIAIIADLPEANLRRQAGEHRFDRWIPGSWISGKGLGG